MSEDSLYRRVKATLRAAGVLVLGGVAHSVAAGGNAQTLTVHLGDYRFSPEQLEVPAGTPVMLKLVNTDSVTPHNFSLKQPQAGLDLDVDVAAGKTHSVVFTATEPGSYAFHCDKKLLFMKSHRDRGMQGTLVVLPTARGD